LPSAFISGFVSVVSITIGTPEPFGSARSLRIISMPFITGMFRSVITRLTASDLKRVRPSAPSAAPMTR